MQLLLPEVPVLMIVDLSFLTSSSCNYLVSSQSLRMLIIFPKFLWRHGKPSFKKRIKPRNIGKSTFITYFRCRKIAVFEHISRAHKPKLAYIFRQSDTAIFFHRSRQMFSAFPRNLNHAVYSHNKIFSLLHFLAGSLQPERDFRFIFFRFPEIICKNLKQKTF